MDNKQEQRREGVTGSYRTTLPGAKMVGRPNAQQHIDVTIRLRPGNRGIGWDDQLTQLNTAPLRHRNYLNRKALAISRGATAQDIALVGAFALNHGLKLMRSASEPRTLELSGTIENFEKAFDVKLALFAIDGHTFRGREGLLTVPGALSTVVTGVFGLDNRPIVRSRTPSQQAKSPAPHSLHQAPIKGLSIPDIAAAYHFPTSVTGAGQCIALIELNSMDPHNGALGGYLASDITKYAKSIGRRPPDIENVFIGGGANNPGQDTPTDHEVTMDIEIAAAVAPDAKLVVYFAPNNDAGFINAVAAAVHDAVRKPEVISISWGIAEEHCTEQLLTGLTEVLEEAAAAGVTVCCSTGDFGASDMPAGTGDGRPHVEFPASSPLALACGGTKLALSGTNIGSEVVWNDGRRAGGGGVSIKFSRPNYQQDIDIPRAPDGGKGRGTPDVAANATGYKFCFQGEEAVGNGTSAVAPLWAGLVSLLNEALDTTIKKPLGFLNPFLYGKSCNNCFRSVAGGTNDLDNTIGKYVAHKGWNPCCGLGSPHATKLLSNLVDSA